MKRAILYMRVSTLDQHTETQAHDLRQMAAQRGYQIEREYTDVISGAKARRPGLDQLLADARKHRFDVVLVWAFDRLARSVRHFLEVLDELNHLQIEFVSFRENIDTGGPLGRAMLVIAEEQLKTLGVDKNHPSSVVPVYAPISGVVIAQNVTNAAAAGVTFSGSATAFTIADLSTVWIICDVYENDIPKLQLGQTAGIELNAYPGKVLTGHISDIGPVLDASIRTAKVRNPGCESRLRIPAFSDSVCLSRPRLRAGP